MAPVAARTRRRPALPATERSESDSCSSTAVLLVSSPANEQPTAQILPPLGSLSARYESNGNPGSIGYDSTGGWSYGTYQIATLTGTFSDFMEYLAIHDPDLAKPLEDAGGDDDATKGTKEFRAAWVKEACEDTVAFEQSQHDFIKSTHYDVQVEKLKQNFGLDANQRSRALQNVVWSMAVQMGKLTQTVFKNALKNITAINSMNDAEMITLLYAEQSKVNAYSVSLHKGRQSLCVKEVPKGRKGCPSNVAGRDICWRRSGRRCILFRSVMSCC